MAVPARTLRPALVAALVAATAAVPFVLAVRPAGATSCAIVEDASPEQIASGTDSYGGAFFDHWDFAVVGTVTAIRTDERQGSPTYGATEVDLRVAGVLGVDQAPASMTLRSPDPGWMSGYPYEVGVAYFVPVVARTPDGVVNSTFLCDPISSLADAEAAATELAGLAAGAGIPFATPGDSGPGGPGGSGGASGERGDGTGSWFVPVTSALAVGAAAVAGLVLRRRAPRVPGPAPTTTQPSGAQPWRLETSTSAARAAAARPESTDSRASS